MGNETRDTETEDRRRLRDVVSSQLSVTGTRIYAVMDGAAFPDLEDDLQRAGLVHRPLFFGPDSDQIASGPWLVSPYDLPGALSPALRALGAGIPDPRFRMEQILTIATQTRAVVFWIGTDALSEDRLFRHLRTINKVLLPKVGGFNGPQDLLLFRHANADVISDVLPVLSEPQHARLLGPARSLLFLPTAHGASGICSAEGPAHPVKPPAGPLAFSEVQIDRIEESRLRIFDRRMATALEEKHLEGTSVPDDDLVGAVTRHRRMAQTYGIRNEQHFMDFVEVMLVAGPRVVDEEDFRAILHRRGWLMEEKCRHLRRRYLDD